MPAYEFAFSDVNPPVHAWAVMQVYEAGAKGAEHGDLDFLERAFHKLLFNFTWWTNRVDGHGNQLFGGGFFWAWITFPFSTDPRRCPKVSG